MTDFYLPGEKTRKIDELIANNFKDATRDDIELYAQWRVDNALKDAEFEAYRKGIENEYRQSSKILEEQSRKSSEALDMLVSRAWERFDKLDGVVNGLEK